MTTMLKPDSPQRFDDREQAVTIKIPVIGLAIVLSLLLGAVAGVVAYRYRSSTRHAGSAQQAPPAKGTAPEKPLLRRADPQIVNGSMEVTLTLDQAVPYDAHRLEHPDRVYVDLHDARLAPELSGKTLFVNSGGVSDIRLAQTQSDSVRVVLDLEKRFDFSVNAVSDPHSLVIKLTPPPAKHSKKRRETKKPSGTSAITREGIGLAWL